MGEPGGRLGPGEKGGLKIVKIIIIIISGERGPNTKSSPRATRSLGTVLIDAL